MKGPGKILCMLREFKEPDYCHLVVNDKINGLFFCPDGAQLVKKNILLFVNDTM